MKSASILKSKIALCTTLIPLIFTYACFNYQTYPDEWAPLQKPISECGDISGIYNNVAEKTTNKSMEHYLKSRGPNLIKLFQVSLVDFYNRYQYQPPFSQIVVQIELLSKDKIKIIAQHGNTILNEKVLVRASGDFDCISGMIKVSGSSEFGDMRVDQLALGAWYGWESYYFSKSKNGDLILKAVASSVGGCCLVMLPIPLAGAESFWYQYEPVVDKKTNQHKKPTDFILGTNLICFAL